MRASVRHVGVSRPKQVGEEVVVDGNHADLARVFGRVPRGQVAASPSAIVGRFGPGAVKRQRKAAQHGGHDPSRVTIGQQQLGGLTFFLGYRTVMDCDFVNRNPGNWVQDHSHSSFCLGEDGYARQGVLWALCRNHRGWLRPFSGCVALLLRGDSDSQATKSSSLVGFHRNMLCRSHDLRVALGQSAGHVPARDTLQVIPSHSSFRSRVMCPRTACRSAKPVAAATSPGGAEMLRANDFLYGRG